jgi:hypothetical protein
MVAARSQQTDDSQLDDSAMLTALDDLLRDGVLRERSAGRWAPSRPVEFAHPVLFDYAAAIIALGDVTVSDSVADILDGDPDLAMVLRPSLDYRLAIVWHNDPSRTSYWRLALRLAAQRSGHMLAAAAAATVATHELRDGAELSVLESACATAATDATWTINDARGLAFLVAAGLDAPGTNPAALGASGQLLERLAVRASNSDDVGLALLVAQLCRRAAGDHPLTPGTHAAQGWVQAAIAAVRVGLADLTDLRRADLADYGGRALAMAAILVAAAAADTIRLVIADPALRAWGGYRSLSAMADALIDRLEDTAPTCSDAIDLLIENLTDAEVWNRLLHRAAISESVGLANALRPVPSSPSLLAHGQTWPAAGPLAARVSPALTPAEYQVLERTSWRPPSPARTTQNIGVTGSANGVTYC